MAPYVGMNELVMWITSQRLPGMNTLHTFPILLAGALTVAGCGNSNGQAHLNSTDQGKSIAQSDRTGNPYYSTTATEKLDVSLAEWKKILPADLYQVAFEKGTERPFTGKFEKDAHTGIYRCAVCGNALFDARTKFDSGTGWPSYYQPLPNSLQDQMDLGHGMMRTEVICKRCGAHLGHVFEDGPEPTGLRYCINAVSLDHSPAK